MGRSGFEYYYSGEDRVPGEHLVTREWFELSPRLEMSHAPFALVGPPDSALVSYCVSR